MDQDNPKRARSTPVPGETNESMDTSRVSDSIGSQGQTKTADYNNDDSGNVKSNYHEETHAKMVALSLKVR